MSFRIVVPTNDVGAFQVRRGGVYRLHRFSWKVGTGNRWIGRFSSFDECLADLSEVIDLSRVELARLCATRSRLLQLLQP